MNSFCDSLFTRIHNWFVGIRLIIVPKIIKIKEKYIKGIEGSFLIINPLLGIIFFRDTFEELTSKGFSLI